MNKVKIDPNKASLYEMMDYLMGKTNIGASAYDANAIVAMNKLFIELRKDTRKFDISTGRYSVTNPPMRM